MNFTDGEIVLQVTDGEVVHTTASEMEGRLRPKKAATARPVRVMYFVPQEGSVRHIRHVRREDFVEAQARGPHPRRLPEASDHREQLRRARVFTARLTSLFLGLACGAQVIAAIGEFTDPAGPSQHALHLVSSCFVGLSAAIVWGSAHESNPRVFPAACLLLASCHVAWAVCRYLRLASAHLQSTSINVLITTVCVALVPLLLLNWAVLFFFCQPIA